MPKSILRPSQLRFFEVQKVSGFGSAGLERGPGLRALTFRRKASLAFSSPLEGSLLDSSRSLMCQSLATLCLKHLRKRCGRSVVVYSWDQASLGHEVIIRVSAGRRQSGSKYKCRSETSQLTSDAPLLPSPIRIARVRVRTLWHQQARSCDCLFAMSWSGSVTAICNHQIPFRTKAGSCCTLAASTWRHG